VPLGLHPHIVSCYYVRTLGGIPRIFAEYVEGGSLADWIQQLKLYEGGPEKTLERILDVAIQFARGLHYAHEQGLVHQDVKPANVMMTSDGIAKVTDFGLANARALVGDVGMPGGTRSILVSVGGMTPAYCSPEQAAGSPLSRKTDMWSWGLSVLEMFMAEITWQAGQVAPEVLASYLETGPVDATIPVMPLGVAELLKWCFQREPRNRPANMLEVATALQEIYQQERGHVYPREVPQPVELKAGTVDHGPFPRPALARLW
jgi:serine/threonine protein kinase